MGEAERKDGVNNTGVAQKLRNSAEMPLKSHHLRMAATNSEYLGLNIQPKNLSQFNLRNVQKSIVNKF